MSQDPDKAWEIQSQTPGVGGDEAEAVVAWALPLPPLATPQPSFSPHVPTRSEASPVREEAVYNAFSQRVHGQSPNLLQVHAAVE